MRSWGIEIPQKLLLSPVFEGAVFRPPVSATKLMRLQPLKAAVVLATSVSYTYSPLSRKAAEDLGPGRKPWVEAGNDRALKGRKEVPNRLLSAGESE